MSQDSASNDYIVLEKQVSLIEITRSINSIIIERFCTGPYSASEALLKVSKILDYTNRRGRWIVSSNDSSYIFGFRVECNDCKLYVNHGVNVWSHWASDYLRERLAERLDSKICSPSEERLPESSSIYWIQPWANSRNIVDFVDKIKKLPISFQKLASQSSL